MRYLALAAAAHTLAHDLSLATGGSSLSSRSPLPTATLAERPQIINAPANFLKHADRDRDATIEEWERAFGTHDV